MSEPSSPCIRQCCLNDEDVCLGCFRHLSEITAWHGADLQERQEILLRARHRKDAHIKRFGGK